MTGGLHYCIMSKFHSQIHRISLGNITYRDNLLGGTQAQDRRRYTLRARFEGLLKHYIMYTITVQHFYQRF